MLLSPHTAHANLQLFAMQQLCGGSVGRSRPPQGPSGTASLGMCKLTYSCTTPQGTAINPARALGPAAVYHCYWNQVWVYALGGVSWPRFFNDELVLFLGQGLVGLATLLCRL